jgi:large subunit ribosomal protein L15
MGTTLHTLKGPRRAKRRRKRVGRGPGSGTGKTSGKGVKGQKARTGHHGARVGFEGGQMPLVRRLPKRGFKNAFRREIFALNIGAIVERFPTGMVALSDLHAAGLVPARYRQVKVLGQGEATGPLVVRADAFSASAKEKIEKSGGRADLVSAPLPPPDQG